MTALSDFRRQYPQYDGVPDKELADALHSKYYSNIPIDDYYSQIGLDATTDVDFFDATGEALKRTAGSFVTGATSGVLGLGQFTPFDEEALDIQESIEAGTRDFLGYDPAYDDSTAAQVGEVAGTIGSFIVPGEISGKILKAGRIAKTVIAATQGAGFGLTTGAKEREAAEERGIDISAGQEVLAKLSDAGIGSLEAFGLPFRVFRGLPRGFFKSEIGKGFQDRIESMIAGGLQEGVQEAGAGIARDIAALNIYDPDRQVADSAIEDFTVGGIAGGVLDLALGAFGRKVPTIDEAVRQADLAQEGPVREAREEYEAGVRARETGRKQRAEQVDQLLAETREEAMEGVEQSPLDIAIDYRRTSGSDIPRAELEFKFGSPLDDVQYNSILGQAQEAEATPILALPSPDSRKLAAQKAVEERLKKLGLSDRVVARVVDSVFPRAILDEAGNITYEVDARDPAATEYGAYQPVSKVIQLSVDQVFADARGEPVTEEMLVNSIIGTLNHEVYHALRNLDVVTQEEVTLLEKLARKYQKAGTKDTNGKPQSYAAWANSTYVKKNEDGDIVPELDPVRMAEESVAEMISDALAGKLLLDGKPVTLGGKPRNIIQKIVGFFKEMVGFTSEADARNFSDFLTKLEAGEVGGRQPEIRTPYLVERGRAKAEFERQQEQEKGLGKQAISDKPIVEQEDKLEDDEEDALQSRRLPAYKDDIDRSFARETFVKEIEDSGLEAGAYINEFEIDELNLTPSARRLMRALERDDYLGFDRVDDLFVQLFDETGLEGYDASPQLKSAVGRYVNEMTGMTGFDREETLFSKRYTGAPADLESPQKLGGLRRVIKGLAQEGEPGRFWYERSGKALLNITGGDKEKAKRLAQAIAITSPQTPVPTNFDYAVQAYYQHEAGRPIKTGMFPSSMTDKLEEVFSGKDWEGRKTNNFYNNVMRSIDPTIEQGVTTDLWMMRAFGYKGDSPTEAQYTFVENEVTRLADELGWEPQQVQAAVWVAMKARTEAKPVRKETERISERLGYMTYVPKPGTKKLERKILDEDGHRSVWLGQALKYDPTREEKEDSKFDFEDAAKNNLAQISWESIPGRTTGHMPQVFDADYSVLQNYHVDISKAFLDADGNDIVARELGVLSPGDFEAPGHFEGRVSPGTQTQIVAPKKYKSLSLADIDSLERKGEVTADEAKQMRAERIEPSAENLMAAYAAVRGILMKQDGVGYHKPFTNKSLRKKDLNAFDIDIGRPLSEKETARLAELLADASGHGEYNPIGSDTGARLINFDYLGTDNNDFNNMVVKSLARMEFDNGESFSANRFAASAGYIGNDWSVDTNGEGYIRDIEGRSSDLSGRVRDLVGQLQPRIQAVDQEYAGKYGWAVNPDINRNFSDSGTGRANTASYAGTVEGALFRDGRLLVSHFAGQKRPTLDPSKAGTGADRTKRNRPTNAVWVGVTKAKTDPYVRESLLGPVESQYAINLADVYVVDDVSNPLAKPDPENIWTTYTAGGGINYDEMLRKARKKGYKGILINSPEHGKLVLWSEPLSILDEQVQSRRTPTQEPLITRKRNPAKLEQAVLKDEILAQESQGFPRVSFVADPEAQYVAQNPDSGYTPRFEEEQLRSRRPPDRSPSYQSAMNDAVGERETGPSQLETYMQATGEGKRDYWLTKFKQGAINRFARLEALNQDPNLRDNLADSSSIAAALFADRSRGVVAAAIKYGVPVYRNGITKVENFTHNNKEYRGLVDLMSMLYSKEHGDLTKDAQAYAIAKRGGKLTERTKNGKPLKAPLTPAQREEIEKNAEAYLDAKGNSIIKEWYSAWQAYNDYTIRFLRDTGVLDAETAQLWRDGADYIPFYRAAAGEKSAPALAQRVFGRDLTSKAYIKEYKGSEEAIDVPMIEAIGLNLTAAIEMGMRNVAQQRIVRDMQRLGLAKQLKKKEQPEGDPVTLKVDGKEVRFDVYDPLIFASMESVPEMSGIVTSVFAKPANFLREMVTRDPGFMAVNMLRDTLSTYVTSGSNFIPVSDTLRGLSQGIETLERSGVVGGYDYSNDPDDVVKFYQKEMKRRGVGPEGGRGSPIEMIKTIWDWAGEATTRSDAATRNAVYNDVLARTGNEAEAHFQALEVINFSRRGSNPLARVLTATIPFLNARFQGLDVFWRAGFGRYSANSELNRRQAMQSFYTRAAMLSGLTALYYLLVSDNDQYKEQSEHVRDNNWILPTPSGVPVKLPIPFEVGLVFKTIPETFLAARYGDKSSREVRETLQRGVVSTLEVNILGIQAISPLVEAAMNHSFYTGRDIVPYYMDSNVATGLQDRVGTSQIAKFVGAELGISPIKIDHVLNGYGGTIGGYVLAGVDTMLRSKVITGDDASKMPALRLYEYPLMKRFFASKEGSGLREDAYDLYREINKIITTSNKLRKEGRMDELEAYLSSRQHILALKSPVYSAKKRLDVVRKQRDAILRADMDAERKREMLDDLDGELNEYLKIIPDLKKRADLPAFDSRLAQRLTGG